MSGDIFLALTRDIFIVTLKLGGPILGVAIVVGVAISILQAVTQIQEMTLTFVPKILAIALTILVGGAWMLRSLVSFSGDLFARLPEFVR